MALITILTTVIIVVNVVKGSSVGMSEIDYEAAMLVEKIVYKAIKITQGSRFGVGFEFSPWDNSFHIKIYPKENDCDGDYQLDIDGSYYIDGNGKEIRGLYTPVEITKENCLAILEKLKEY